MVFVYQACAAFVLVTLTRVFQSAGMAALIQWAKAHLLDGPHRLGPLRTGVLMVQLTGLIVCLHMTEVLLWAWFYRWKCFVTWESAFYFSATSYSTIGRGDPVLPSMWRMVDPVESLTGVLMCGVSASLLFAIVTHLVVRDRRAKLEK